MAQGSVGMLRPSSHLMRGTGTVACVLVLVAGCVPWARERLPIAALPFQPGTFQTAKIAAMPAPASRGGAAGPVEMRRTIHVPKPRPGRDGVARDVAALRALVGRQEAKLVAVDAGEHRFAWPVRGEVLSVFGRQPNGGRNDGIDIAATAGTAVLAAERGTVVYAGTGVSGYGMMLMVRHRGDYTTVYAQAGDLLVTAGDYVDRGQVIARLGGGPGRLHFELRAVGSPVDPAPFLSPDETVVASNIAR